MRFNILQKVRGSGSAPARNRFAYIAWLNDVVKFPEADHRGVLLLGDIQMKENTGMMQIYLTSSTQEYTYETVGDADSKIFKLKFTGTHPGTEQEALEFVKNFHEESFIILIPSCDSGVKVLGSPDAPMTFTSSHKSEKASDKFIFNFEQEIGSENVYHLYNGIITLNNNIDVDMEDFLEQIKGYLKLDGSNLSDTQKQNLRTILGIDNKNIGNSDLSLSESRNFNLKNFFFNFFSNTGAAKIGINQATPTEALHVSGNIKSDALIISDGGASDKIGAVIRSGDDIKFNTSNGWQSLGLKGDYLSYNDSSGMFANDILKRIDQTTGINANYRETTIWYDGTAINATKVDDVIFKKIGTKYYVLVDFGAGVPVNVKYFGVKGDGVTDDTQKNQKALDLSIKYGFVLYYPKGVYLVSWANKQSGYIAPVDFSSSTENYKSVQIIGDGTDKSKILLAPGQADLQGRYTECARYYANKAGKITSKISIKGISIDMNARSNVFPSASGVPFFYEQSHALVFNGHATNEERVDFIDIDDVEIIDKIGGGIVFATAPKMSIGRITVDNFVSLKHTQFPNSIFGPIIKLGMRGDLELGAKSDASFITGCKMQYTQIEPVIASSAEFKRNTNISDVIVDKFEFTDRGGFSFVNASKLTAKSFLVRGIQGDFTNCTVTFDGGVSNGNLKFFGGTILVKYNSTTNSLSPAQFGIVAEATEKYTFDSFGTVFKIDSSDPNITPTGFMFRGNGSTTQSDAERFRYNLYGCSFDPRSEKNIEAYAHGIWKITNSIFACRGNAIYTGSFTGYYCSVEIVDCNFKDVVGRPINIQASVNTFYLKVVGTYDMYGKHFFERTAGTAFIPNTTIPNSATFISDAPILNGFMPYNQLILKKDSTGGLIGWRQSSLTNVQNWREINEFTKAATQADSSATDVSTLKTDFNSLLSKLKTAGIVS